MFAAAISSSACTVWTPKLAVARQVVEKLGGRRDRVAGEEQLQAALHAGRDQAQRNRLGAVDVAIVAGRQRRRLDFDRVRRQLGRLAEVVAGFESGNVGVEDLRLIGELRPPARRASPPPAARTSRRSSPRAKMFLLRCACGRFEALDPLGGARGQRRHRYAEDLVAVERAVLERVELVARLVAGCPW